jgi:AcrR family transcriptional regulator
MTTREDLIEACTLMIATDGLASFSLRKLAARIGIKAPSIYEHFDGRDALLAEVRRSAAGELRHTLIAHCQGGTPKQRLISAAGGYLHFARTQPSLFALLFKEFSSLRRGLEEPPSPDSPFAFLLARVQDFAGPPCDEAESLAFGLWSLVHGAAILRQTHLKEFSSPFDRRVMESAEALLEGWKRRKAAKDTTVLQALEPGLDCETEDNP